MRISVKIIIILSFFFVHNIDAQHTLMNLIPTNTSTHTAQQNGDWFDSSTWAEGTIPSDAAIVYIPMGIAVTYEGQSSAHIFAIRVDGTFTCTQTNSNDTTSLIFDTFVGTMMSKIQFHADNTSDGKIQVTIKPFDIEAHEAGTSGYGQVWNTNAKNHFSDRQNHYRVTYDIGPDDRFKTYALSLAGDTSVDTLSKTPVDDLEGILGRTDWDSTQLSIGLVTMGELEIIGQEKSVMGKLSVDALKSTKTILLESTPVGWEVGDTILVTLGGNKNALTNGNDVAEIANISGTTITTVANLKKNHEGRSTDDLHCYVGNLNRNITFRSAKIDSTHRGHLMAMHNAANVQIKNAAFINMGRTDKSKLLDDRIWNNWVAPVVGNPYVSALGQECSQLVAPPANYISNHRGRYSIHLHQLGAANGTNIAQVTGNVIWGNPGWGITHHGSHANVSDNVIYQVVGSGLVSEAGNETGFWDNNLIVDVDKGHTFDVYESSLFYDDYLFSGQGMGMKGRGVVCRNNVIADTKMGVGITNFNAAINSTTRMDAAALANVRPGFQFDQFPLSQNGYAVEGDGILPLEVALILENTTVISATYGLSSIERDMGVNHESRSIFDNFKVWGANTGIRITYQNDYSFRDLFVSGKNDESIGLYMWKHSHNHSFERIKLVDLKEGIYASRLVENNSFTTKKTRNNGFTPWLFIDLETENVTDLYGIHLDNESSPTIYTEHPDNPIHLSSSQLSMTRPVTFTLNENADLELNLAAAPLDLQFTVDGVVTDRIGAYEYGVDQASSMDNLRNEYKERVYEFASQTKLEEYLDSTAVYKDPTDNELYFIIYEYVPDRITYEYKAFPIRVKMLGAPSTGVYANPLTEDAADLEPQNELITRSATATQSSTSTSETYEGVTINVPASRAIDGNSNARINVGFYQFGIDSIGSSAITNTELEPWWEMDLGEEKIIEYLDIWNTVELNGNSLETPSAHFKDFYVLIDDQPFGAISLAAARAQAAHEFEKDGTVTRVFSVGGANVKGRYVRVQAVGTTKIGIAEVDVIGRSISTNNDCAGVASGLAYQDECGDCVGGTTGLTPCALDANYEWKSSIVLPVELISFDGKLIENKTRLDWSTASELNVHGFDIEKSNNATDWENFAFVAANNQPSHYREWDNQPFEGVRYYRLKIIDFDGSFEYSNIISVHRAAVASLNLYPNPTTQDINIEFKTPNNSVTEIKVVDILGRIVFEKSISTVIGGFQSLKINMEGFASGSYFVRLKNGLEVDSVGFVLGGG